MSRYDGLIIPRSYSEYINKTDAATLSQALQLNGVLAQSVSNGNNAAVTSNAVNGALANYINKTDAATLQQALQLPGVLSKVVAAGDNKAVTSNAVNKALANYQPKGVYTQLITEYLIQSSTSATKKFKLTPGRLYILYSYIWNNPDVMGMYLISIEINGSVIKPILNSPLLTVKAERDTFEISCEFDWDSSKGAYCNLCLCKIN